MEPVWEEEKKKGRGDWQDRRGLGSAFEGILSQSERGGGGRLRHATGRMKKENVRWALAVIKAEGRR